MLDTLDTGTVLLIISIAFSLTNLKQRKMLQLLAVLLVERDIISLKDIMAIGILDSKIPSGLSSIIGDIL